MRNYRNEIRDFCVKLIHQSTQSSRVSYPLGEKLSIYFDDSKCRLIIEYDKEVCVIFLYTILGNKRTIGSHPVVGNEAFSIKCSDAILTEICKMVENSNLIEY